MKFSTYDRENDIDSNRHCAEQRRAGWWFKSCAFLNLNGVYGGTGELAYHNMIMYYLSDNTYEPIRTLTMKIRVIN